MTDKELFESIQEGIDDLDSQIANLPTCSIRTMLVAQRDHFAEFLQLVKTDGIVRSSYKKFVEECDKYEEAGFDESMQGQLAFEACVDLGTRDYVSEKMRGGKKEC